MNEIKINRPIIPIGKVIDANNRNRITTNPSSDFKEILQTQIGKQNEIKFSKHAVERLQSRNINLSKQEMQKIDTALTKAADKGVKETLIIMGNTAFIANVKNRTIVTAATGENLKDNVFTNIDGAVII